MASAFKCSVISVPRPRVLPRGSGYISKEVSWADELKTCCTGLGFFLVFGGIDAT